VIPKNVDEYLQHVSKYPEQDAKTQLSNPAFHIHGGTPPSEDAHISYNILLNLVSVVNTEDKAVLWHFISRYVPEATPENAPTLDKLTEYAVNYFQDFIKTNKQYRAPNNMERAALEDLLKTIGTLPDGSEGLDIQTEVYEVGKRHEFEDLKAWFKCLYEILLGQSTGPRMGSFIALYGLDETKALIQKVLDGESLG